MQITPSPFAALLSPDSIPIGGAEGTSLPADGAESQTADLFAGLFASLMIPMQPAQPQLETAMSNGLLFDSQQQPINQPIVAPDIAVGTDAMPLLSILPAASKTLLPSGLTLAQVNTSLQAAVDSESAVTTGGIPTLLLPNNDAPAQSAQTIETPRPEKSFIAAASNHRMPVGNDSTGDVAIYDQSLPGLDTNTGKPAPAPVAPQPPSVWPSYDGSDAWVELPQQFNGSVNVEQSSQAQLVAPALTETSKQLMTQLSQQPQQIVPVKTTVVKPTAVKPTAVNAPETLPDAADLTDMNPQSSNPDSTALSEQQQGQSFPVAGGTAIESQANRGDVSIPTDAGSGAYAQTAPVDRSEPAPASTERQTATPTRQTVVTLPENLQEQLAPLGRTVTLRLEPDSLGPARLQLTMHGDQLTARFTVENKEAKALLEHSLGQLGQQLDKAGVRVEQIHIHLAGQSAHQQLPQRRPDWYRKEKQVKQEAFSIDELLSKKLVSPVPYSSSRADRSYLSATQVNMVA